MTTGRINQITTCCMGRNPSNTEKFTTNSNTLLTLCESRLTEVSLTIQVIWFTTCISWTHLSNKVIATEWWRTFGKMNPHCRTKSLSDIYNWVCLLTTDDFYCIQYPKGRDTTFPYANWLVRVNYQGNP